MDMGLRRRRWSSRSRRPAEEEGGGVCVRGVGVGVYCTASCIQNWYTRRGVAHVCACGVEVSIVRLTRGGMFSVERGGTVAWPLASRMICACAWRGWVESSIGIGIAVRCWPHPLAFVVRASISLVLHACMHACCTHTQSLLLPVPASPCREVVALAPLLLLCGGVRGEDMAQPAYIHTYRAGDCLPSMVGRGTWGEPRTPRTRARC